MRDLYYLKVLCNWSPRGRATRSEWWSYNLVHPFVSLAFILLSLWLDSVVVDELEEFLETAALPLFVAYMVLSYWLFLALTIRRLHDVGRSAWSFLSPTVFIVSGFDGSDGPNQYGLPPGSALPIHFYD